MQESRKVDPQEEIHAFYWWLQGEGYAPTSARTYRLAVSALLSAAGFPPSLEAAQLYLQEQRVGWQRSIRSAWRRWVGWVAATERPAAWAPALTLDDATGPPVALLVALSQLIGPGGLTQREARVATWGDLDARKFDGQPFLRAVPSALIAALDPLRRWACCDAPVPSAVPLVPMEPASPAPIGTVRLRQLLQEARALRQERATAAAGEGRKRAQATAERLDRELVVSTPALDTEPKLRVPGIDLDKLRED